MAEICDPPQHPWREPNVNANATTPCCGIHTMVILSGLKLAAVAVLTVVTQAAPVQDLAVPAPPTQDSFYTLPKDLANHAPGTILRHRKPPSPISAFRLARQNLKDSHQIFYRTTDNFGNATATVLTVLVPHNADYRKVISHQNAEDAAYANCAPSYALQFLSDDSGFFGTIESQAELLIMQTFLEEGWIVIVPDHEGPKAEFLANRQAGYAVLDGIRAALASSDFTGINKDARVGMWGYSGGSLASGFAAEQHQTYAPELKIAGAAIGGLVPDILNDVNAINKGAFAGLIPGGIIGLSHAYPVLEKLIDDQLLPEHKEKFYKSRTQCLGTNIVENPFVDFYAEVKDRGIFEREPITSILAENNQGQHVPTIPLFVYKSINDEVSPVADSDKLVKYYCDNGASVEYTRDFASEHGSLAVTGITFVLPWLRKIMNGQQISRGCSTKSVATTLTDASSIGLPKFLFDAFSGLLGRPIGPGGVLL
ncbi:hypothetical protein C2857_006838 [Epichloe festucae Fl1]|uniref:Uncharacterized protein n=1 Tax=Epichloe festucae (strain Fl1) TaxID=877507 RepID=A0A7S9KTR3_EPIFF|nr:hypothetical protein C2857_006838 [Epichloe festucae Fl1]